MTLLRAHNVFKTYRLGRVDVPVLRGASLEVRRGEWVAVLGASGSGKSTLLHLLGGLDRPDAGGNGRAALRCPACGTPWADLPPGTLCPGCGHRSRRGESGPVEFDGRPLNSLSPRDLDRYRHTTVGFVFQFYHLLPELTVLENVLIASMVHRGWSYWSGRSSLRAAAAGLLESFGLGPRLRHRPAELSGGERQRVAIARALVNDPAVLLADEPTGNLDRGTGRAILDALVAHRQRTGRTIVLVTHDPEVAALADRTVTLRDGRVEDGNP
jgi:lipoprotein-releasing system ATP-binding protein